MTGNSGAGNHRREKLRQKRKSEAFSQQLFIAAFGAAALIAPMFMITLHPTKVASFVAASAFVIVVAVLLAYLMTEVLVVLVGSSPPSQ